MIACYQGYSRFDTGLAILLLKREETTHASVVSKAGSVGRSPPVYVAKGPFAWSDTEALLGLLEETKRMLTRVLELCGSEYGFYDIADARKR